jgi:hypothetical protein
LTLGGDPEAPETETKTMPNYRIYDELSNEIAVVKAANEAEASSPLMWTGHFPNNCNGGPNHDTGRH